MAWRRRQWLLSWLCAGLRVHVADRAFRLLRSYSQRANVKLRDVARNVVEVLVERLHLEDAHYEPADQPTFHTGRAARLIAGGKSIGTFGELSCPSRLD